MATPLLATKLHAPVSRQDLVERQRLTDRLAHIGQARLTLVSAPPGFGKSTLLGHWLRDVWSPRASAWLSLDDGDDDRATFWRYVVGASRTAKPGLGDHALALLEAPDAPVDAALQSLINELAANSEEIVLVLDDFHVIHDPRIAADLAYVIDRLPGNVHLVVLTRADPALPLSRLRARGELVEIRAADLRFDTQEVTAYLNGTMGLALASSDVATLEARTEGWIAGLQLAALSIHGRADGASFIASFAGDDRYIVDYLVDEVLARQSDAVRTFLLQTAILDRLTGRLADAVTGGHDGQAMLDHIDRANLFLVALDDQRRWYRYHHLFAEVLRIRLQEEHADEVPTLHRRASHWFEREGQRAEAIRHALAGRDFDHAAELIELEMPAMRRARQERGLREWLEALPSAVLEVRPVLAAGYAGTLMQIGEFEHVERLLQAVERWLTQMPSDRDPDPPDGSIVVDRVEFGRLPGAVAIYRAALGRVAGDIAATMSFARRALELADAGDPLGRGAPAALLGLAHWERGDLDQAHRWFAAGMVSLGEGGFHADVVGGAVTLADIRIAQGRLGDALREYEDGLRLATARDGPPLRGAADMHVGIAGILRERNDLTGASEHLAVSRALGDENGLPKNPYRWRLTAALIRAAEGDLEASLDLLDEAEGVFFSDFSPDARPIAAVRARLWIAHGRLAEARGWARDRGSTADDEVTYVREFESATLARLLLAEANRDASRQPLDQAMRLTDRLIDAAEIGGRDGAVIDVAVVQALARQAAGEASAALASLEKALAIAEREGYVNVFLDEGAPMRTLLGSAAARGLAPGHIARLLADFADRGARGARAPGLVEPLSERELDVLRLLASDLTGPEIANRLVVSLNTVRSHTKNIYAKLAVNSRRAAVRRATELGLIR